MDHNRGHGRARIIGTVKADAFGTAGKMRLSSADTNGRSARIHTPGAVEGWFQCPMNRATPEYSFFNDQRCGGLDHEHAQAVANFVGRELVKI